MSQKIIDKTGQRFGKLVVVEKCNKRTNQGNVIWLCKCDCGRSKNIISSSLRYGGTQSCGCLLGKKSKDLTNRRFSRLTAIKIAGNKCKENLWLCNCDCGGVKVVHTSKLLGHKVNSCGCLQKASHLVKGTNISPDDVPIELVKTYMENRKLIKILKQKNLKGSVK